MLLHPRRMPVRKPPPFYSGDVSKAQPRPQPKILKVQCPHCRAWNMVKLDTALFAGQIPRCEQCEREVA